MATSYTVAICLFGVISLIPPVAGWQQLNGNETVCRTELNGVSYVLGEPYAIVLFGLKNVFFTDVLQAGCAPIPVFLSRLVHACNIYHDLVEAFYCEFLRILDPTVATNSEFDCDITTPTPTISSRRKRFISAVGSLKRSRRTGMTLTEECCGSGNYCDMDRLKDHCIINQL